MAWHDACVDRHPPERRALNELTFGEVQARSRRVASWLRHVEHVRRGDRIAIIMGQRVESALLHVACSRLGAIAVPLSPLFGADGLRVRLDDAAPRIVVTTAEHAPTVSAATRVRIVTELGHADDLPLGEEVRVGDEAPAWLIYTSGTTGKPKGAVLPHRVVAGRMPGFLAAHAPFDAATAVFWSPADWSWIGGLHDSLLAPWHAGAAVVARERRGHLTAAEAYDIMARERVTNAFLPPTAMKMLARSGVAAPTLSLRVVHSAGEPLAAPVKQWVREALACEVSEVYGLTECAFLIGTTPGDGTPERSMGRAFPTHCVSIVGEELCVAHGDATMMLGYWTGEGRAPELPLDAEGYLHTGDLARVDADGFYYYEGRKDDLIKTSGYRVGPAEVEAALLRHPAVAECAVVGVDGSRPSNARDPSARRTAPPPSGRSSSIVPDDQRGQRVKAFVKRAAPVEAGELMAFVKEHLAAHAYPREVEFVDELPTTVSGKLIRRRLRGGHS